MFPLPPRRARELCYRRNKVDGSRLWDACSPVGHMEASTRWRALWSASPAYTKTRAVRLSTNDRSNWTTRRKKETSTDPTNLRELDVKSFRVVPVVRPVAEAIPEPAPLLEPTPVAPAHAEEVPVATTGTVEPTLPKTAGSLPALGLLGLLSLAGGLALHRNRSSRR